MTDSPEASLPASVSESVSEAISESFAATGFASTAIDQASADSETETETETEPEPEPEPESESEPAAEPESAPDPAAASTPARIAIVTGGSRGIGRAIAERLARDGFGVTVGFTSNEADAYAVVDTIEKAGGSAIAVKADVADETEVERLFDLTAERFGGVDVVVHAAGMMILGPLADFSLDDFDKTIRTNLRGTYVVDQFAARRVRAGGAIINFSTTVTRTSLPNYSAYAATKGAVEAIGLILAKELGGRDITVNTVAPGPTATDLFLNGKDDALLSRIASQNPSNRLGETTDIAEVVAFLAGPGRWINGQVIFANGGTA
jgi:3-oxoacyl-[acyl-carrier protein] reductase